MFIKLITTFVTFIFITQSYAFSAFIKEGGGYGVKPIREIIKESEENNNTDPISLNSWLNQRDVSTNLVTILNNYRQALKIRKQVHALYDNVEAEDLRQLRRDLLFIQGLLIVRLTHIKYLELDNGVELNDLSYQEFSPESQLIMGITIEDGYLMIDLLKDFTIKKIVTDFKGETIFNLKKDKKE